MIIIPAVDIKNGKCVRLQQGRKDAETVFSHDPSAMARKWQSEGADLIHVFDLDGAFEKSPKNLDSIKEILKEILGTVPQIDRNRARSLRTRSITKFPTCFASPRSSASWMKCPGPTSP